MNDFHTVVFMYKIPVLPSVLKKNCIYELSDLGYQIIIADLTYIIDREYDDATEQARISDNAGYKITYKKLKTYSETRKMISEYSGSAFFFPMFSYGYEARKIYRLFTKYNVQYGCIGSMCANVSTGMPYIPTQSVFERLTPSHLQKAFYNRIWRKCRKQKKAYLIGYGAQGYRHSYRNLYPCDTSTKELFLHTFDYENFLLSSPYQQETKYCVFLDQYIPFHPDNISYKNISPSKYYDEINAVFDRIREIYDLDVIVAAHPKADYVKKPVFGNDVKVLYGMTASLVKNAEFVLAHFSNSIDYAVMAEKPVLLLKTPEITKVRSWVMQCEEYAKVLNLKTAVSDRDIPKRMQPVNSDRYHAFMKAYAACKIQSEPCLWKKIMNEVNPKQCQDEKEM